MKLSLSLTALFVLGAFTLLPGCSGNDGAIEVDGATTPLTAEGNDTLFTIRVTEAPEEGYALTGLVVKATPDGKEAITLSGCTPNDANANQKLDEGETVACAEGGTNILDPAGAGAEVEVELFAQIDGAEERIGDATWTPKK